MAADKFTLSKESGIHHKLALMAGEWEGMSRVWFEPAKVEDEASVHGSMKVVLDGRFILHEYESTFKGKPISGIALIGYSISSDTYQCAWVDSFHMGTGILFSESPAVGKLFSVLGSYGDAGMPEPWGWRTVIEHPEDDKIVITAYNISPGEEEVKATETVYHRRHP